MFTIKTFVIIGIVLGVSIFACIKLDKNRKFFIKFWNPNKKGDE